MSIFDYIRPANLDAPGHRDKGGELEHILDLLDILTGAWKSDEDTVPVWTAGAGTPSVGDGSLTGRLQALGKTRNFSAALVWGSLTTGGTAGQRWEMTIPGGGTSAARRMGPGWVFDTSAGANYPLQWKIDAGATTMRFWRLDASPGVEMLNNFITFATGDLFLFNGTIEIT